MHEIQRVMVSQLTVLETMSPVDFLAFRDALGSASGFQSAQFRELEILTGLSDEVRFEYDGASFERRFSPEAARRFDELRSQPSLRDALHHWLRRTPLEEDFVEAYLDATAGGRYRVFTVILRARSFLIPRRLLPDLREPGRYGFARELT